MSWLLAGCYGLVLMTISGALQIRQSPRFIGVGTRHLVRIHCSGTSGLVQWYRLNKYNEDRNKAEEVKAEGRISFPSPGTQLFISALRVEDKGVYFCKVNDTWGPGTELQVFRSGNRMKAQYRTNMKDGLIMFQALLLAVCIAALMLRKHKLGLAIETCDGGLYEELSVYTRPDEAEAPWK
ncbi:hypothetical protein fugu_000309 [Takifugu bimaculatus]|uniref:Ig-like domain-containing protein n=1 Tax=Takifugu bimaculatus TaxID=433685 RepID=A0A4Z2CGL2_9TELE|nr:hypothetical protein fugu_000309 [Takifugu bimaculatus]